MIFVVHPCVSLSMRTLSTPSPPRNVKPPKRYVGLKPHRRRSSGPLTPPSSFSLSVPMYSLSQLPPPHRHPPLFSPSFRVYAIHGDSGTALTALMHSANIASAVARTGLYLHYGFFLSCACVRAYARVLVYMLVRSETRRRRRKSRCPELSLKALDCTCAENREATRFYDFGLSPSGLCNYYIHSRP